MKKFNDGVKTTVSYTNTNGGSSRCSLDTRVAENIEKTTGQELSLWVQAQHDDIISSQPRFLKYKKTLGHEGKTLSAREIGDIIRLSAVEVIYEDIPDSDL